MKKYVALLIINFIFINLIYSQSNKNSKTNKYSTEIGCENPYQINTLEILKNADLEIDLERYKTIIRNGDISALENLRLTDLQLGVLSKTELKLLRNMYYAKKGYIFSDEDLTTYFNQFEWYKPSTKNITFTDSENYSLKVIKIFEQESTMGYSFTNQTIIWKAYNGGADQQGAILKYNNDLTFEYIPREHPGRLKKVTGTWSISNNKIILNAQTETVLFGGYVADDGINITIKNATPVTIYYEKPVTISLPLNESESYIKYNFNFGHNWMMVGSTEFYEN